MTRHPPALSDGMNVFSRQNAAVGGWHHVVGQVAGRRLELYVDGVRVGVSTPMEAAQDLKPTPCQLVVGRLKQFTSQSRPFQGGLDELALYDRPLTAAEIQAHAASPGHRPLPP